MKRIIYAIITLALCGCGVNKGTNKAIPNDQHSLDGKNVVFVYGGWDGHDPSGFRDIVVPWLQSQGASVDVSNNLDIYTNREIMSKVDLVVQCWTMGTITSAQERALLSAVRNGAGIAGWHGGTADSFSNNTDYQYMIGGQWVAHPDNQIDYVVNITDHKDPVTKGIKDFAYHSEQYNMHVDPNVKVPATTTFVESTNDYLKLDYSFKRVFGTQGNEDLLLLLVNCILPDKQITSVTLGPQEQQGDYEDSRDCIFDVYCTTDNGSRLVIEI